MSQRTPRLVGISVSRRGAETQRKKKLCVSAPLREKENLAGHRVIRDFASNCAASKLALRVSIANSPFLQNSHPLPRTLGYAQEFETTWAVGEGFCNSRLHANPAPRFAGAKRDNINRLFRFGFPWGGQGSFDELMGLRGTVTGGQRGLGDGLEVHRTMWGCAGDWRFSDVGRGRRGFLSRRDPTGGRSGHPSLTTNCGLSKGIVVNRGGRS
jgi:hypothetical protein